MIAMFALAAVAAWPTGKDRLQDGSRWACIAPATSGVQGIAFRILAVKPDKVIIQFNQGSVVRSDLTPTAFGNAEHPMAYTDKSLGLSGMTKEWHHQFFYTGGYASFFWNTKDSGIDLELKGAMAGRQPRDNFQIFTCERKA